VGPRAGAGDAQQLSYAGLNAAANRLAHVLQAEGVQPGEVVAIGLTRPLELAVAQRPGSSSRPSGFVELRPMNPPATGDVGIEVQGPRTTVRLQLPGVELPDLVRLSRAWTHDPDHSSDVDSGGRRRGFGSRNVTGTIVVPHVDFVFVPI